MHRGNIGQRITYKSKQIVTPCLETGSLHPGMHMLLAHSRAGYTYDSIGVFPYFITSILLCALEC